MQARFLELNRVFRYLYFSRKSPVDFQPLPPAKEEMKDDFIDLIDLIDTYDVNEVNEINKVNLSTIRNRE